MRVYGPDGELAPDAAGEEDVHLVNTAIEGTYRVRIFGEEDVRTLFSVVTSVGDADE